MDPITIFSLAVAVADAATIAAKACKNIYKFQQRLINAPADIVQLTRDVEVVRSLLQEIHHAATDVDEDEVSPDLLDLWARKEGEMRHDLESIQRLTERLANLMQGSTVTGVHLWARVRSAYAEQTVSKHHRAFSDHIQVLGLMHSLLNGSKFRALNRTAQENNQKLDQVSWDIANLDLGIRHGHDTSQRLVGDDLRAIKSELKSLANLRDDYRTLAAHLIQDVTLK
ncbi:MAG: hypothetical protein M1826_006038 [Phylliscum demangeonii]|nr:MAG: hypothetical protein M1826_006038 [Phylliscum demangeonii]